MLLKQYAQIITKLAKEHPDAEVIYSIDDEGNAYNRVYFAPTLGQWNESSNEFDNDEKKKVTAVCIN